MQDYYAKFDVLCRLLGDKRALWVCREVEGILWQCLAASGWKKQFRYETWFFWALNRLPCVCAGFFFFGGGGGRDYATNRC